MKHLILVTTLFLVGACGSSIDKLANSINNASGTAQTIQCEQKSSNASNCSNTDTSAQSTNTNGTPAASSITVSNTTTVTTTGPQTQRSDADILDNSSWVTPCADGITYKASFAKGIETLTTNVYQDNACQVFSQSIDQTLSYAVDGDNIEFNDAAANVFVPGAPFQTISTDGNTLSFSGNETEVYTRL